MSTRYELYHADSTLSKETDTVSSLSLALIGRWETRFDIIKELHSTGYTLHLFADINSFPVSKDIVIVSITEKADLQIASSLDTPWLAYCQYSHPDIVSAVYRAGALAVLPHHLTASEIVHIVRGALTHIKPSTVQNFQRQEHTYRQGDLIPVNQGEVIEIQAGVITINLLHEDGRSALIGLAGPQHILIGNPVNDDRVQLIAHTNSVISLQSWSHACHQPHFLERLYHRLQQAETWGAIQSHPSAETRLIGILQLIAGQFGTTTKDRIRLNIRLTHEQLAAAIHADRTTTTRLLKKLRQRGWLYIEQGYFFVHNLKITSLH
ncbi:MAG: Crp/Fnr family transcriptional regulator [Chloroflexota bacterium]